ncbi:MAG: MBL fold metallo-hydrolase [Methanomicrobiales archaeon]|nr:MBL fold metallo-hydrolase [Methanomicrobiales archaeon]
MEIVPGIHQVDNVNGNCYVIARDGLILIDTGLPNNSKKIITYIQGTLKRKPSDIRTIILTHYHLDHTGNVNALKAVSTAKVAIHEADSAFVSGRKRMPVPKGWRGVFFRILSVYMKSGPFKPGILLKDRDTIEGLTCIHIPGHTPGSICLIDTVSGVLFAGDTLRFDGANLEGPPAQFTPNMNQAHQSIKKIATLNFDIMLPGHGIPLQPDASVKVREFASG